METKILIADDKNIKACAEMIRNGNIVAFPTETVYGLGANGLNEEAAKKIFVAKGRPATNPLILHVSNTKQIDSVAVITDEAKKLIEKFMPGPITLVLRKKDNVPNIVTAGCDTVAVRMPDHPVALKLIEEAGMPVCAPSANTSSRPSPTMAEHVFDDLNGKIPVILDGGKCPLGLESTIINMTTNPPRVLRAGAVELSKIEAVIGALDKQSVMVDSLANLKTPEHYVPKAELVFSAYYDEMSESICKQYDNITRNQGKTPVILCLSTNAAKYGDRRIIEMGDSVEQYARVLFEKIREAEKENYNYIIAEGVPIGGIGTTLLSRLIKLSGGAVI